MAAARVIIASYQWVSKRCKLDKCEHVAPLHAQVLEKILHMCPSYYCVPYGQ